MAQILVDIKGLEEGGQLSAEIVGSEPAGAHEQIGIHAFRVVQIVQPISGQIEKSIGIKEEPKTESSAVEEPETESSLVPTAFLPEAAEVRNRTLATLIRRCSVAELRHMSEGKDIDPDLHGRPLDEIKKSLELEYTILLQRGLNDSIELSYALRYIARKLNPQEPFSIGIDIVEHTGTPVSAMIANLRNWYKSSYSQGAYNTTQLSKEEEEKIQSLIQFALMVKQHSTEGDITAGEMKEIFTALMYMVRSDRMITQ